MATLEELPLPPPKESFAKSPQQRQATELRRLYKHIHPELRQNLAEAVADDLAEALGDKEATEGDVQCLRWIFEHWRLDAIGAKESVPGGDVQATSGKFEARTPGDVQATRMLFETQPLDSLGSGLSVQGDQSPLELRSELRELKGNVQKTVRLFQAQPLCALRDEDGAMHEVQAACREEIQSHAVRTARWLFETRPLDAIHQDPGQVRIIRGISLEEGTLPDVSAARWLFETQPLDAIRELELDEKDFQPSPDLVPPGPDVQRQRKLFETRPLDMLKGDEEEKEEEEGGPRKEEVVPGDVRSTLWLFETKPLDTPRDQVQMGHLQRVVGPQGDEGLTSEASSLSPSQSGPQSEGVKGDVKAFKNLFETLPLDSIGQREACGQGSVSGAGEPKHPAPSQDTGSPMYALQDGTGHLHALTSVSREQVVDGDVQRYRWMFETQPLDQLGRSLSTVDVVRGITRQEVPTGEVGLARWLFETQPLEVIHQREQQERQEEEGKTQGGLPPETIPKGDVQNIRWLFETCSMSELGEKPEARGEAMGATKGEKTEADIRSCTWMFASQHPDKPEDARERHLQVSQVQAGDGQTDQHVFETETLLASNQPGRKRLVRVCSRVEIPSGQVSQRKEIFRALEAGQRETQTSRSVPEPVPAESVHKFTWLFENCPLGSLGAESLRGNTLQEEQTTGPSDHRVPERQETAAEATLQTLHAAPGVLHRGGILMEVCGPGELCLAKFTLPGPGQAVPHVQKEELVSGELPRIVRQVLLRSDVAPQGLLVQEDPSGQLQIRPLRLPTPGSSGNVEDMDPELQQLLACSLGSSVARTGLVMQETEQGLVALTAYSLQPRPHHKGSEKRSVQLLASCIDKGDLQGLQCLRWEPPADSSPVPASEDSQRPAPMESSIIHVPPLDISMGQQRGPEASPCPSQATGKIIHLSGERKQERNCTGQKGTKLEGSKETTPGPGSPGLQAAMQSLQMATAEAQSLHQQVLSKHKQGPSPGAASMPCLNSSPQALATATGTAQSNTGPMAGGDPRIPQAPRKVSGRSKALPRGLPGGRVTLQDGIYTAHPVRTFDSLVCGQASETKPLLRAQEDSHLVQASSPFWKGPGASLGHGACAQRAWGPREKASMEGGLEDLQATENPLKEFPLAHHSLASGPQSTQISQQLHNASVPPPPPPAAVTEPDPQGPACHNKDSIQQAGMSWQDSLLHDLNSSSDQRNPEEFSTKTPKLKSTMPSRKKPQLPPKPAHLSQLPPPLWLLKLSTLPPGASNEVEQGDSRKGKTNAGLEPPTACQENVVPVRCPSGQSQPSLRTIGSKSQTTGSNSSPKLSALDHDPTLPYLGPSQPEENPTEVSKHEAQHSTKMLQESQHVLQGLLNEAQALENETSENLDITARGKLFELVPPPRGVPPTSPSKPEVSVDQAFGELSKVSTEVAQLKEQTLARLLDIEAAVHKVLNSMSSLQPVPNRDHSQGPPKDPSACKVSVMDHKRPRPNNSRQELRDQTTPKSQSKVVCHPEAQDQHQLGNSTEATDLASGNLLPAGWRH